MKINTVHVVGFDRMLASLGDLMHCDMKKCSRVQMAGAGWRARVQHEGELYIGAVRRSKAIAAIESDAISELLLGPSARKNCRWFQIPRDCSLVDLHSGKFIVNAGQYGVVSGSRLRETDKHG